MRSRSRTRLAALLLPLLLAAGPWVCSAGDAGSRRYPSPKAVFDVYRAANDRRDWRTCFSLLTPEGQADAIFEAFFACAMHPEESNAVLKRYGVDEASWESDLRREYKAKYGAEPSDNASLDDYLNQEYEAEYGIPPAEPRDIATFILLRRIQDKPGFYRAALDHLLADGPPSRAGELEQVVIEGDTATGQATVPAIHPEGGAPRKGEDTRYKMFHFRKVNGGWLLDSL